MCDRSIDIDESSFYIDKRFTDIGESIIDIDQYTNKYWDGLPYKTEARE